MKLYLFLFACLFIFSARSQDFTIISQTSQWTGSNGWNVSVDYLIFASTNVTTTAFAISPSFNVSTGYVYGLSFQVTALVGTAVLEIGFGNDTANFQPVVAKVIGPAKNYSDDNNTNVDETPQPVTFFVEFRFDQSTNTSLIFNVHTTLGEFLITNIATTETPVVSTQQLECSSYLGFSAFQIGRLLATRSATKLVGHVADVISRLNSLKNKVVIGGSRLTQVFDYGQWINALNSFNEGNACPINVRDFDLYNWLVQHQINAVLNKYNGDALQKKQRSLTASHGRVILKAPVFRKSLIDKSLENTNIF